MICIDLFRFDTDLGEPKFCLRLKERKEFHGLTSDDTLPLRLKLSLLLAIKYCWSRSIKICKILNV